MPLTQAAPSILYIEIPHFEVRTMKRSVIRILVALALAAFTVPAGAAEIGVSVHFSAGEISIIRDYYARHGNTTSPGKKGGRQLPPGIAKNLARGKALPPGIAKQFLPDELITRLPPPPAGFERVTIDGKVLLVEVATQVIHDILTDIVFGH